MTKRALHRVAIIGVIMLVVLVLVLLLVPGIAADSTTPVPGQVGNIDPSSSQNCVMVLQDGTLKELAGDDVEVFKAETPNADDFTDGVALLRCQATLTNTMGVALTSSGVISEVSCAIQLDSEILGDDGNPIINTITRSWSQTISATGNATLTCQFKRSPHN